MKKTLLCALTTMMFLSGAANFSNAMQLYGPYVSDMVNNVRLDSGDALQTFDGKFSVEITGFYPISLQIPDDVSSYQIDDLFENGFYYKDLHDRYYALGIQGIELELNNLTQDEVLVFHWGQSQFNLGTYHGIPMVGNMKYEDAGNPSATPDTILAPGTSQTVTIFIGKTYWVSGEWHVGSVRLLSDGTLHGTLLMKVESGNDGSTKFYTYNTPNIILSRNFVEQHKYNNW